MATIPVRFEYFTGLAGDIFSNPRLAGSWSVGGTFSDQWTYAPMRLERAADGCPCFRGSIDLDASEVGRVFYWGVVADGPGGNGCWMITTEQNLPLSAQCIREFALRPVGAGGPQEEVYFLTACRRFGAQKLFLPGSSEPALRFAVWAPRARSVSVVFGSWTSGYVDDQGGGVVKSPPPVELARTRDGIWASQPSEPALRDYAVLDHVPYMFRLVDEDGSTVYRTDLFSRCQIGAGTFNPNGSPFEESYRTLEGVGSCSVVVNAETVTSRCKNAEWPGDRTLMIPDAEFWQDEFAQDRPLPTRIEDLVIYELHVGSLAAGTTRPGTFEDAIGLLDDHLVPLGVNAVELLPIAEFGSAVEAPSERSNEWGYGNTHHFAAEFRCGGRDQLKHFVRECHRRGIAVIMDVVYNHFSRNALRAEWAYDSGRPENNSYYWYEGQSSQFETARGGYLENGSTGDAPRLHEENVRHLFISSAAALLAEFHVDGFRVDLTDALHRNNVRRADGLPIAAANQFGAKLLREWCRTLRLLRPGVFLVAEDHTGWDKITTPLADDGIGFDATWYAAFYHNLVGTPEGGDACLVARAGFGDDRPLRMDWFAGALASTGGRKISYHISHDEAGNSAASHRTIVTAVNGAPLVDKTRDWAEARSRFASGMAILSAGTPMFLMGEEVGASADYKYDGYLDAREDVAAARNGSGARLFRFYRDLIALRRSEPAIRSRELTIVHVHNENRVLSFLRPGRGAGADVIVLASLANRPFDRGYEISSSSIADGDWREVFNSDADAYGGAGVGNGGGVIASRDGRMAATIPASGFVILRRN